MGRRRSVRADRPNFGVPAPAAVDPESHLRCKPVKARARKQAGSRWNFHERHPRNLGGSAQNVIGFVAAFFSPRGPVPSSQLIFAARTFENYRDADAVCVRRLYRAASRRISRLFGAVN